MSQDLGFLRFCKATSSSATSSKESLSSQIKNKGKEVCRGCWL